MSFSKQVQYILLSWLIFLCFIHLLDRLPHYPMHLLSWLNFSLFFLLGVTCFFIIKKDHYFFETFLHFGLSFILVSLTFVVYYIGVDFVMGDNIDGFYALIYSRMIVWTLLFIGTLSITLRYIFHTWRRWTVYFMSWVIGVLSQIDFWYQAFTVTRFPFRMTPLENVMHYIRIDVMALIVLGMYFLVLIRKSRPNGAFIHGWAISLFIMYVCDIFDYMVAFWQIDLYGIDQYFVTLFLLVMSSILLLRLASLESESYRLREQLIFDKRFAISTPVIMKDLTTDTIMQQLKQLIGIQSIFLQCILAAGLILISVLAKQSIVLLKVITLLVIFGTIWNIYFYIVSFKNRKGQLLNQKLIKPSVSKPISK